MTTGADQAELQPVFLLPSADQRLDSSSRQLSRLWFPAQDQEMPGIKNYAFLIRLWSNLWIKQKRRQGEMYLHYLLRYTDRSISVDINLLFVRLLPQAFYRCSHVNIIIMLTFHQASCRVDIFSFSRLLSSFTLPGPPLPRTVGCLKNSCKNTISRKLLSTFVSSSQD